MRERPILFSGPMVRAILAGTKTQTRRLVRPMSGRQREWLTPELLGRVRRVEVGAWDCGFGVSLTHPGGGPLGFVSCPYGQPGDHLWVRETIRLDRTEPERDWGGERAWASYVADGAPTKLDSWGWQRSVLPAIHCPRGLSRLTLDVLSVRVERLQDISEDDAVAEGARYFADIPDPHPYRQGGRWSMEDDPPNTEHCLGTARFAFGNFWDSINSARAPWKSNPWVWVVEFRRLDLSETRACF